MVARRCEDRVCEQARRVVRHLRHARRRERHAAAHGDACRRHASDVGAGRTADRVQARRRHLRHEGGRHLGAPDLARHGIRRRSRMVSGRKMDRVHSTLVRHTGTRDLDHAARRLGSEALDLAARLEHQPGVVARRITDRLRVEHRRLALRPLPGRRHGQTRAPLDEARSGYVRTRLVTRRVDDRLLARWSDLHDRLEGTDRNAHGRQEQRLEPGLESCRPPEG